MCTNTCTHSFVLADEVLLGVTKGMRVPAHGAIRRRGGMDCHQAVVALELNDTVGASFALTRLPQIEGVASVVIL